MTSPEPWRDSAQSQFSKAWSEVESVGLREWVKAHRVLMTGARPGKWNDSLAVSAWEPMAAFDSPKVRRITLKAAAQIMKTEFFINCALYSMWRSERVLAYWPDKDLAKEIMATRIRPALAGIEGLEELESAAELSGKGGRVAEQIQQIMLRSGGSLKALSVLARTALSSESARVILVDELDLMKNPKEVIAAANTRSRTFSEQRKICCGSTPKWQDQGIDALWKEGSQGEFHGRCPHCGELTGLRFNNVNIPKDADGEWISEEASIICAHCGCSWSEAERLMAIRGGKYIHAKPERLDHLSFFIPGGATPFEPIAAMVEETRKIIKEAHEKGDWETRRRDHNEAWGEAWNPNLEGIDGDRLKSQNFGLALAEGTDEPMLDERVCLITAGVDVGRRALYCEFVGWGLTERKELLAFGLGYHVIECEEGETMADESAWLKLESLITGAKWRHPSIPRSTLSVVRACVDYGYMAQIVLEQCNRFVFNEQRAWNGAALNWNYEARIVPVKGRSRNETTFAEVSRSAPKRGTLSGDKGLSPFPAQIGTRMIKDLVYEQMLNDQKRKTDFRALWPSQAQSPGYNDDYFKRFSNERRTFSHNKHGERQTHWEPINAALSVEPLDCRVYSFAAVALHAALRRIPFARLLEICAENIHEAGVKQKAQEARPRRRKSKAKK